MPGEDIDPRILQAIRSGTLLSDPGYVPNMDMGEMNAERLQHRMNYGDGLTGSSPSQSYSGRMYTPTARIAMPATGNYNFTTTAGSHGEAESMGQHFQAHLPHARIGLTTNRGLSTLRTDRYQDGL